MGISFGGRMTNTNLKISYNKPPIWNTPVGLLGEFKIFEEMTVNLSASDPDGEMVMFEFKVGQLPLGCVLNPNTGVISGIPSQIGSWEFVITATDGKAKVHRTFSIIVNNG
jgi:hypothetical protein